MYQSTLASVDSIATSLFVWKWLSWKIVSDDKIQITNDNTDTDTRCLVQYPLGTDYLFMKKNRCDWLSCYSCKASSPSFTNNIRTTLTLKLEDKVFQNQAEKENS